MDELDMNNEKERAFDCSIHQDERTLGDGTQISCCNWIPKTECPITPCTSSYYEHNVLGYDQRIEDGFYDPGRALSSLPTLHYLLRHPEITRDREVVVVDSSNDIALQSFLRKCISMVSQMKDMRSKVHLLALLVSNFMGGSNELLPNSTEKFLEKLKRTVGTVVVPIGEIQHGVCRHRSILFKYLADRLGIQCRLIRGEYWHAAPRATERSVEGHSWNVVLIDGKHFLCDVMHDPGSLFDQTAEKVQRYHRHQKNCGRVSKMGPGLASLASPLESEGHPAQVLAGNGASDSASLSASSAATAPDLHSCDLSATNECCKKYVQFFVQERHAKQKLLDEVKLLQEEAFIKDEQIQRMARAIFALDPNYVF